MLLKAHQGLTHLRGPDAWAVTFCVFIDMHKSIVAICMLMQHDEAAFKRKAKKSFTSALIERVPPLLAPMTTSHAEALRRCGPSSCTSLGS